MHGAGPGALSIADSRDGDSGATLIELMFAIAILATAFVTFIGGMFSFTYASASHAQQARGAAYIRQYAEAIAGVTYTPCASTYAATGFAVPAGWHATPAPAVAYWSGGTFSATCGLPDTGLQRITLTLGSDDGRDTETLDIVKRAP